MSSAEWVIRNEDDAWALLKEACSVKELSAFDIKFDNWPVLDIKLVGDQFSSNLSTKMMEAFIELQKNINRTYARLYYNYSTARGITNEDKEQIELFVQVSPGSSEYKINLQKIVEKFVKGVAGKMTGKQATIIIVSGALMWTSHSAFKAYLESQKEMKGIEMRQLAGDQETQRMKIFADAMKHEPQVAFTKADAEEVYNKVLKAASTAKTLQMSGTKIKGQEAQKLARATRSVSEEVNLSGEYRVVKIDNSKSDHFEVKVNDGMEGMFTARLDDSLIISQDEVWKILEAALRSREPVRLMIEGVKVRGEITKATITDVPVRHARK
ncbi:hypothetical protein L4X63_20365 [Geomonas sp. Red32]|uniref:hypothetical protein n=1 Tax=Geomonas sp. Red32 TaxID=2912856 RepID=UPI00202CCE1E|nr:hypothetical protein [Geomonas sp. Red32]MCM0083940.1 hypothetical protein [Geomonas sp. Red32]